MGPIGTRTIGPDGAAGVNTELLVVCLYKGEAAPESLAGAAAPALQSGDFSGKEGEMALLYTGEGGNGNGVAASRLMLLGLGERDGFTLDKLRRAAATAAKKARSLKAGEMVLSPRTPHAATGEQAAQAAAEGAALGLYRFRKYKSGIKNKTDETDDEEQSDPGVELLAADDEATASATRRGAEAGEKIARGARLARDLANEPGSTATPEFLAGQAEEISTRHDMGLTVLDRAGIDSESMTGLSTVGRSSSQEPRFIVLEHRGGGDEAPVVLVGKGVTFDSGGISIKPSAGMEEMKFDMGGGAAVLGAMEAVGALGLPVNVVALVPATENLPAGDAYKPGDVLQFSNGKTVEVISTDAEGRLILADALLYAKRYDPACVIDCATLTGAVLVGLGKAASGLMGNDDDLVSEVQAAGESAGERAWPLPLFEDYTDQIESDTADIKNTGGRNAGTLTAGAFLKEFADFPWAHLDVAGTAWDVPLKNPYVAKGATGTPARLLVELLRARSESSNTSQHERR
ncbi:leucyl aminopeptidase [Rubrobacter aplysinae]|uniref:leucyl aminopeptidase n=1 Tax=Rubrobacter aplysinae TaxID=909625 RepID=UPI00069FEC2D|nr:leucyl aminopeptidase [Rubrobacter aplysinae]